MSKAKKIQSTISRISAVLILIVICGVGYFFYPLVMKNLQKQNVVEVAQGKSAEDTDTIDFEGLKTMNSDTVG